MTNVADIFTAVLCYNYLRYLKIHAGDRKYNLYFFCNAKTMKKF